MPRFLSPPGAHQVEMSDGTLYRGRGTTKKGYSFEVDDMAHARAMSRGGNVVEQKFAAPRGTASRRCEPCKFEAWPWTRECPRCGADMEER